MTEPIDPFGVALSVARALDALGVPHTIGGSIASERVLHVHPPEDILLQKLRWFREGGSVSDRQWRDVIAIVRVQDARLDRAYLRRNAPLLGVLDLLERALEEGGLTA